MGMRKGRRTTEAPETGAVASALELIHLRREVKTALELAIAGLASSELIERLATAAGLLEALSEFPPDSAPARALVPTAIERANAGLEAARKWEKQHKALA